jgi:hypothetical protein
MGDTGAATSTPVGDSPPPATGDTVTGDMGTPRVDFGAIVADQPQAQDMAAGATEMATDMASGMAPAAEAAAGGLVDEFENMTATDGAVDTSMAMGDDMGVIADPAPAMSQFDDVLGQDVAAQTMEAPVMPDTSMPDAAVTMTADDLQPAFGGDEPQNTGFVPPQYLEDATPDAMAPADDYQQFSSADDQSGTDDSSDDGTDS